MAATIPSFIEANSTTLFGYRKHATNACEKTRFPKSILRTNSQNFTFHSTLLATLNVCEYTYSRFLV